MRSYNLQPTIEALKIAVDPRVHQPHGPEVYWALQTILSGIGYPWREMPFTSDESVDVAYGVADANAPKSRVFIHADLHLWNKRSTHRLSRIITNGQWTHPLYRHERAHGTCGKHHADTKVITRDVIFDFYWLATGQEESFFRRNKHGHLEFDRHDSAEIHGLQTAVASEIAVQLEHLLSDAGFPSPTPRWPHGKLAAACLSHDVDYPEIIRFLEPLFLIYREGLRGIASAAAMFAGRKHHWHFDSWMRAEQDRRMRSVFYFVPKQGSLWRYATGTPDPFYDVRSHRFKRLFKRLIAEGFEIGMQASYRACESFHAFVQEKQLLEEMSGQCINGNRHHYWHLHPREPESTLVFHEKAGLLYDASLNHERYIGWRRGLTWPFFPFIQKERRAVKTLQLPTAWMDDQLFGHKRDNPGEPFDILHGLMNRVTAQGGCFLISIHEYVFDHSLFPEWSDRYLRVLDTLAQSSSFWMALPKEIAEHWVARHNRILGASHGLSL